VGDALCIDTISGRVRAMMNERGESLKEAPPSTPVLVLGLSDVPAAGDRFEVVGSEREARSMAEDREDSHRLEAAGRGPGRAMTLQELFGQFQAGQAPELNLILKADVNGSLEPIAKSLEELSTEELKVSILHQGAGHITESDVMLASASQAIIIGFRVSIDEAAQRVAAQDGVDIRQYDIIYNVIDDVDKALKGLLEPVYADVVIGQAEVRAVFSIRRQGKVAGCYVLDGEITRNSSARVLRNGQEVFDASLDSLKRFKEDVTEVRAGFECGLSLAGFDDFQEGDIIEAYVKEQVV
jgi:translation initiation factor IF-2